MTTYVRFGSLADIGKRIRDVRSTLRSGHYERGRNQTRRIALASTWYVLEQIRPPQRARFSEFWLCWDDCREQFLKLQIKTVASPRNHRQLTPRAHGSGEFSFARSIILLRKCGKKVC
jgi:hypothetical protein